MADFVAKVSEREPGGRGRSFFRPLEGWRPSPIGIRLSQERLRASCGTTWPPKIALDGTEAHSRAIEKHEAPSGTGIAASYRLPERRRQFQNSVRSKYGQPTLVRTTNTVLQSWHELCVSAGKGGRTMTAFGLTRRGVMLGAAAALAVTRAGSAATLSEIKKRGFMTVATEDDYQPFEFTQNGKPTGYDQELLELFKRKAGFEIRQDIIPWTGILPGVTTGKYDAAVTAILVTQERMKTLDFCSPVVESVDYYLKRKGDKKIQGIKDLSGLSLGVEAGSAMLKLLPQLDDMLKVTGGKLGKIVSYQGYPEAYQDLALGRIDFVVNTRLSLESIAKSKPDTFEVGQPVSKPTYIAWAVVKGNTELLAMLNEFLLGTRKDGTMYALQKKWFDITFENMPEVPTAIV
jgi:polar amino acid transport system substrate-binding protein